MLKTIATALSLLLVSFGVWQTGGSAQNGSARNKEADSKLKPVMERKLGRAKALLEGLATEDFEAIAKNAQALSLLSMESGWNVLVTEDYLKQSNSFRRSLESIRDGAKKKNLDRATLGYVDMTIRCVECHKYARTQNNGKILSKAVGE